MSCPQHPSYDGDIAGLGVRLSFYLQNFILVLLVDRSYGDAENALWTFIATSFGLTIAALVQFATHSLTLLEGILVSQLSWLANLGTFLALASYSRSKGEDNLVKIAAVLQGYLSMVLTVVMWIWSAHLLPSYECNHAIRFVWLFAVDVPALGAGRVVALVFSSLTMLVYTGVTFTECMAWRKHGMSRLSIREKAEDNDLEVATKAARSARKGSVSSTRPSKHRRKASVSQSRRQHPSRQQWLGTDVDPIFFGIFLTQLLIFAYFISTTELIISRSNAKTPDSKQWGFGQVLAVTVVIPSAIALERAIRRNRIARVNKEREKKEDEALNLSKSPKGGQTSGSVQLHDSPRLQPPNILLSVTDADDRHSSFSGGELSPSSPLPLAGASSSFSSNSTSYHQWHF